MNPVSRDLKIESTVIKYFTKPQKAQFPLGTPVAAQWGSLRDAAGLIGYGRLPKSFPEMIYPETTK